MLNKFLLFGLIGVNMMNISAENASSANNNLTKDVSSEESKKVGDLDISEAVLDNGLRVIVVNTKTKDTIAGGVGYFVGAADDPRNVVGISHVLEHMMFKGTKKLSGPKLKETIFICNKYSNAFTSYDITFYVFMGNSAFLDTNLKIEADRMQNLLIDEDELNKEKEVIIEERKMRTESDPRINHMEEATWKLTYLFSSYSYPVIGYMDQIKACGVTDVRNHYEKHYVPNNAFVLLVGDITLPEAVEKVKHYFGSIPFGKKVERSRIIDPENTGLKFTMEHESEQISVNDINIIYKIDRKLFDTVKKLSILEMVSGILAGGSSSVLYQDIVDKKELAYSLGSYLDVRAFDFGRLNISAVFRDPKDLDKVDSAIMSNIDKFVEEHLTKERFETEKQKILDQFEIYEDNPNTMMMFCVTYITNGYKLDDIKKIKSIIRDITFEEVQEAAKSMLSKENRFMRIYSHPKKVASAAKSSDSDAG